VQQITLTHLQQLKDEGIQVDGVLEQYPFSCLTAYDASMARVISEAEIEVILIGDSLGQVIQGHDSTLPVRLADMAYHTHCVRRGNQGSLLMTDMPFACQHNVASAVEAGAELMRAGAHCIKIEGGRWLAETIERMRECGIPVCAHLGLCPQSVHLYGGYKGQGKSEEEALRIIADAKALQRAGAVLLLLECVPRPVTQVLRKKLKIPVIGIGAGAAADAQVLVIQDVLGISENPPSFAKDFSKDTKGIKEAVRAYKEAVHNRTFPEGVNKSGYNDAEQDFLDWLNQKS
jgi:3-methyl-2-oxobutanoate hydroxymethyltransferase